MKVGVEICQGWKNEYAGLDPEVAWAKTVELTRQAEELGFESAWVADHFQTRDGPEREITFESFMTLAALAPLTDRIRLGHIVVCAGYRNPALVAKMAGSLDAICGGRYDLGLGAGWKQDEWRAFGYGFPPLAERQEVLREALEVVTRMLGKADWQRLEPSAFEPVFAGRHFRIERPINEPKGVQRPRIPILVGGNGPVVTRRLAIRFADELNLVDLSPEDLAVEMAGIRRDCQQIGRDPSSLRISMFWDERNHLLPQAERVDQLAALQAVGLYRLMAFPCQHGLGPEPQAIFADDCRLAGLEMATAA